MAEGPMDDCRTLRFMRKESGNRPEIGKGWGLCNEGTHPRRAELAPKFSPVRLPANTAAGGGAW